MIDQCVSIHYFNKSKTIIIKALKTGNIKGSKCKDCAGCLILWIDYRNNWRKPLSSVITLALKTDADEEDRDLLHEKQAIEDACVKPCVTSV